MMETLNTADVDVTCLTAGCVNENIIIAVKVLWPDGVCVCGPCGNEIIFVMPDQPNEP
jgi:hypothetical protein